MTQKDEIWFHIGITTYGLYVPITKKPKQPQAKRRLKAKPKQKRSCNPFAEPGRPNVRVTVVQRMDPKRKLEEAAYLSAAMHRFSRLIRVLDYSPVKASKLTGPKIAITKNRVGKDWKFQFLLHVPESINVRLLKATLQNKENKADGIYVSYDDGLQKNGFSDSFKALEKNPKYQLVESQTLYGLSSDLKQFVPTRAQLVRLETLHKRQEERKKGKRRWKNSIALPQRRAVQGGACSPR